MVTSPDEIIELSPYHPWRRTVVFLATFVFCAAASLTYVYSQPGVYRATARLFVPADNSRQPVLASKPANQHNEESVLLSRPVLQEATLRIQSAGTERTSVDGVRRLLQVRSFGQTPVVEISVQGRNPLFLERLLNSVIEAYRDRKARLYEQQISSEYEALQTEAKELYDNAVAAGTKLDAFRRPSAAASPEQEKAVLADIENLRKAYTESVENLAKAQEHLLELKNLSGPGFTVSGINDDDAVRTLEQRATTLKNQLADLQRRFTREYLSLDVDTRALPGRVADLDRQIAARRNANLAAAVAAAEQGVLTAENVSDHLRTELAAQQKEADDISERVAPYVTMQEGADQAEQLERLSAEHLKKVETAIRTLAPQVEVLEPALHSVLLTPNYTRDAGIAIGGSLAFGIFAALMSGLFVCEPAMAYRSAPRRGYGWPALTGRVPSSRRSKLLPRIPKTRMLPPPNLS